MNRGVDLKMLHHRSSKNRFCFWLAYGQREDLLLLLTEVSESLGPKELEELARPFDTLVVGFGVGQLQSPSLSKSMVVIVR